MLSSKGKWVSFFLFPAPVCLIAMSIFNSFVSEGAANLNDMKEMLANLPQFQEQREKVR